jgi:SulP family sulfate permease
LTQFVSQSVILGYVGGTVAAVVIGQLYVIAGMYPDNEADTIFGKGLALFSGFKEIHIPSLIVGAFSFVSIILLKRINKLFPAGLITIVLAALIVYFFNHFIMSEHLQEVYVVGGTDGPFSLIPPLNFPLLEPRLINQMLPIAFAISLLGILETTCVTKSMAVKSGERTSVNQEILSVGVGNLVSSFLGAMPISVSPSRSALNYECRPQTRFAAIFNALFVALFVSVFAFFVNIIPLPTLSALLLITSIGLINWPQILLVLKATRSDRWVLIITFVSCLFFSLDNAFYIGVLLAIVSYLRKAAVPQVVEFAIQESGELKSLALSSACELKPIRVIKVEGELFFGAADVFENSLKSTFEDDTTTKVIILQLKNARDIDATACLALLQLNESLRKRGCHLLIAGLTYPVWDVLSFSGVVDSMGKENLFLFDPENPHHNLQQALSRAKLLSC